MPIICKGMINGQIAIIPVGKRTTTYIVIFQVGGGGGGKWNRHRAVQFICCIVKLKYIYKQGNNPGSRSFKTAGAVPAR